MVLSRNASRLIARLQRLYIGSTPGLHGVYSGLIPCLQQGYKLATSTFTAGCKQATGTFFTLNLLSTDHVHLLQSRVVFIDDVRNDAIVARQGGWLGVASIGGTLTTLLHAEAVSHGSHAPASPPA